MLEASRRPTDELRLGQRELFEIVGRFRRRLGGEQLVVFALRGAVAAGLMVAALGTAAWATETSLGAWPWWLVGVVPLVAIGLALARWPSPVRAARTADHHLELAERLATALEVSARMRAGRPGRLDDLQVHDAVLAARETPGRWPSLAQAHRQELIFGAAAALLALASLVLPAVPRPRIGSPEASTPLEADVAAEPARSVPLDLADLPTDTSAATSGASADDRTTDEQLAQRVQQAQSVRQSLDRLANALGEVSAGQAAAEAIQRGDYQTARDQVSNLGDEADQLSPAAKQQLSQALQNAATQTAAADRQLAERERQASQALARGYYNDERQSLRQLADQIQRSGQNGMSQGQLARDVGRLEQSRGAGQQGRQSTDENGQGQNGQNNQQAGQGSSSPTGAQAPNQANGRGSSSGDAQQTGADQGQSGVAAQGAGDGQQGGPGAGVGTTDPLGDPAGRLDASGERVEVPVKLGAGPGERPATGNEDQASRPNGSSQGLAAEQAQHQEAGQVVPENNLVPGDQRPVIRGYFSGETQTR
jgi:hypothetical protein